MALLGGAVAYTRKRAKRAKEKAAVLDLSELGEPLFPPPIILNVEREFHEL